MPDIQSTLAEHYLAEIQARQIADALAFATSVGLLRALVNEPTTLEELAKKTALPIQLVQRFLSFLVAMGRVEQYDDDFAISQVGAMLERRREVESAIGLIGDWNDRWATSFPKQSIQSWLVRESSEASEQYRRRSSLRQWALTASAIQAAEAMESYVSKTHVRLMELGGGAGVFSAALAYRIPSLDITSIDVQEMQAQARSTYASIGIENRLSPIEADYRSYDFALGEMDIVLLPMVVRLHADPAAVILLGRACDALKPGGVIAIIESLDEPEIPPLANRLESLTMTLEGCEGAIRSSAELQSLLTGAGFGDAQWGILDRGPQCLGLVIAKKIEN